MWQLWFSRAGAWQEARRCRATTRSLLRSCRNTFILASYLKALTSQWVYMETCLSSLFISTVRSTGVSNAIHGSSKSGHWILSVWLMGDGMQVGVIMAWSDPPLAHKLKSASKFRGALCNNRDRAAAKYYRSFNPGSKSEKKSFTWPTMFFFLMSKLSEDVSLRS